ncbi:MAG: hypothetical protein LIO70_05615 [Clostridiales bacterium]|nr:hypothetical protein [Clostridiales bacterium]
MAFVFRESKKVIGTRKSHTIIVYRFFGKSQGIFPDFQGFSVDKEAAAVVRKLFPVRQNSRPGRLRDITAFGALPANRSGLAAPVLVRKPEPSQMSG